MNRPTQKDFVSRFDFNNDGRVTFNDIIDDLFSGISEFTDSLLPNVQEVDTPPRIPDEMSKLDVSDIMGLPPLEFISGNDDPSSLDITIKRLLQSMLVITLEPMKPNYEGINGDTGLDLFSVEPVSYDEIQKLFPKLTGYELKAMEPPFKFAVQVESSFSESWNSDFGDSMAESMVNVGSTIGQEIRYISGKDSLSQGMGEIAKDFGQLGGMIPGFGEQIESFITNQSNKFANFGKGIEDKVSQNKLGKGFVKIGSGSKVDFPQIWRGSSFQSNYTFTLKLYNPHPDDEESYIKHILAPLTHILIFMCPVSDSSFTYGFPLLTRFKCPGLAGLEAAAVSSVDVIKGGDGTDISFKQRPGTVEVRFTLQSLYNTMIIKGKDTVSEDRPTLDKYLNYMRGKVDIPSVYDDVYKDNNSVIRIDDPVREFSKMKPGTVTARRDNNTSNQILNALNNGVDTVRTSLETLDAFSDPILNNMFELNNNLSDINISLVNSYRKYVNDIILERNIPGEQLPLQDRVAIKIRYGLPLDKNLINWFWNNIDKFDRLTNKIVRDFEPPSIQPSIPSNNIDRGSFQNGYNLTSRVPAIQTGTL